MSTSPKQHLSVEDFSMSSEETVKTGALVLMIAGVALAIEMWLLNQPGLDVVVAQITLTLFGLVTIMICGIAVLVITLGAFWALMDQHGQRLI